MVDFTDKEEELAEVLPSEPARPKKITIVVVIAIILAVLYLMGFLGTIPGLIMHVVSPGGFNFAPQSDDPQFRMQAEMQANMAQVTQTYFIPMILLAIASLAVGTLLLYSSIQVLRRGQLGDYRLLNNTFIAAIGLGIVNSIVTVLVQMANWEAMNRAFSAENVGPQAEFLKNVMMFSMVIGVGLGIAFQLAQLIYFIIARWIMGHYITKLEQS
ncbi:hypothetical protein Pan97_18460 [Bremerella volcania]|uniref:Uncharacterized protein n=1 Tax=Bremerella volcania TaxID=2527984 RepID=A0A518C6I8_9BACT|nr:hypothetical protein [Bremerella volcania]QDU74830.1 hypothetical protein Pan97_18460 [Bremerella volcania]